MRLSIANPEVVVEEVTVIDGGGAFYFLLSVRFRARAFCSYYIGTRVIILFAVFEIRTYVHTRTPADRSRAQIQNR